jgi:mRNA-degrading endonuclease RelE of RelBE toxin-antitoxin system
MTWTVTVSNKATKQLRKLPDSVLSSLKALVREIIELGPVRGNWDNYSKLTENRHHCHLKKGQPAYVAVWHVTDKTIKLVEVIYVGTHEKAPY